MTTATQRLIRALLEDRELYLDCLTQAQRDAIEAVQEALKEEGE